MNGYPWEDGSYETMFPTTLHSCSRSIFPYYAANNSKERQGKWSSSFSRHKLSTEMEPSLTCSSGLLHFLNEKATESWSLSEREPMAQVSKALKQNMLSWIRIPESLLPLYSLTTLYLFAFSSQYKMCNWSIRAEERW